MERARIILEKEWREAAQNGMLRMTGVLLTLLFAVFPLLLLIIGRAAAHSLKPGQDVSRSISPGMLASLAQYHLSGPELLQAFLGSQLIAFFLIAPAILPSYIATYSIIGEKREKSLEPLLATPVTVPELLLGKTLAAALPGMLAGWLSFAIYVIGARIFAVSDAVFAVLCGPVRVLGIGLVGPLLAVITALLGLMVSSRAEDPRAAQAMSGLIVLPIMLLIPMQLAGFATLNAATVGVAVAALVVFAGILLYFASELFQRETILTRWK